MKISKFLTLTPLIGLVAVTSCAQPESQAEKIANAIFNPIDTPTEIDNFENSLKSYSDEDRANELVYDLYGWCNLENDIGIVLTGGQTIKSLYEDNTVSIQTVINKCTFDADLKANFLGYVAFVFNKKLENKKGFTYEVGDYIQITFDINDLSPQIGNDCSLHYVNSIDEKACIGIIKQRYESTKENMFYIREINTNIYPIKNSKNLIPKKEV